jgi:hypothetical protein
MRIRANCIGSFIQFRARVKRPAIHGRATTGKAVLAQAFGDLSAFPDHEPVLGGAGSFGLYQPFGKPEVSVYGGSRRLECTWFT